MVTDPTTLMDIQLALSNRLVSAYVDNCALTTKLRKLHIYLRIGTTKKRNLTDCAILVNPYLASLWRES